MEGPYDNQHSSQISVSNGHLFAHQPHRKIYSSRVTKITTTTMLPPEIYQHTATVVTPPAAHHLYQYPQPRYRHCPQL